MPADEPVMINSLNFLPKSLINLRICDNVVARDAIGNPIKGGITMISKNSVSVLFTALLIIGFFIVALPENGYSGTPSIATGCCQLSERSQMTESVDNRFELYKCIDETDVKVCKDQNGEFFPGDLCNLQTGMCELVRPTRNVPTLSEWGLVAMAGVLGVIGFIAIRRKKGYSLRLK